MNNAYPEKPALAYEPTSVAMIEVVAYLKAAPYPVNVCRMAYVMFRNESGNGQHGINNNYGGFQADGNRWSSQFDDMITGTVTIRENAQPGQPGSGTTRIFLAFRSWHDSLDMLLNRVKGRGLYIGEPGVVTEKDLERVYYDQWVTGNPRAIMPIAEQQTFESMYGQALALFRDQTIVSQPQPVYTDADNSADALNAAEAAKDAAE